MGTIRREYNQRAAFYTNRANRRGSPPHRLPPRVNGKLLPDLAPLQRKVSIRAA
jgi:hypothetical protein